MTEQFSATSQPAGHQNSNPPVRLTKQLSYCLLTYKDDEPVVGGLLSSSQLGEQRGSQVPHHHEKGDRRARQVANDTQLNSNNIY